jgi:hypothetical protein
MDQQSANTYTHTISLYYSMIYCSISFTATLTNEDLMTTDYAAMQYSRGANVDERAITCTWNRKEVQDCAATVLSTRRAYLSMHA